MTASSRLTTYVRNCRDTGAELDYRTICALTGLPALEADRLVQRVCAALAREQDAAADDHRRRAKGAAWRAAIRVGVVRAWAQRRATGQPLLR